MCYEWGLNGTFLNKKNLHILDKNKIFEILDEVKEQCKFYNLTGGEPFIYPHFNELLLKIKEIGGAIDIHTNGLFIKDKIKTINCLDKNDTIWISLDGPENI